MRQIRWYVGTLQQDSDPVTPAMRTRVLDVLIDTYGGVTVYPASGYWVDAEGALVHEQTFVFEVVSTMDDDDWPPPNTRSVAEVIREATNQKAVLFTDIQINSGGFANEGDIPGEKQGDEGGETSPEDRWSER